MLYYLLVELPCNNISIATIYRKFAPGASLGIKNMVKFSMVKPCDFMSFQVLS